MSDSFNRISAWWSGYMLGSLFDAACALLVVGLVWWLFRRRVAADWGYLLFLLIPLKLLVPLELNLPGLRTFAWAAHQPAPLAATVPADGLAAARTLTDEAAGELSDGPPPGLGRHRGTARSSVLKRPPEAGFTWETRAMLVWMAVAGTLLSVFLVRQRRAMRTMPGEPIADLASRGVDVQAICGRLGIRWPVTVQLSSQAAAPAVSGLYRPCVLLPPGLVESLPAGQLACVLAHELAHIRRRDLPVAWFQRGMQILHCFNPAVWLGNRMIDAQRELACDDLAVWASQQSRRTYGEALLAVVEYANRHGRQSSASLAAFGAAPYRRRLLRVLDPRPVAPPRWNWSGWALLLLFAAVVLPKLRATSPVEAAPRSAAAAPAAVRPAERGEARDSAPEPPPALVERAYSVNDLAGLSDVGDPDLQTLHEIVTSTISVTSWSDVGGSGTIREDQASWRLVVRQSEDVHRQIASLLAGLRRLPGLLPAELPQDGQDSAPPREPPVPIPAVPADDSGLSVVLYPVRDLLYADPRHGSIEQADFDTLTNVITVLGASTWDSVGGPGSIAAFPAGEALVVLQTADIHERIRTLLRPLYSVRPIASLPLAEWDRAARGDEMAPPTRSFTFDAALRERVSFFVPGSGKPPVDVELEKRFYPVGDLLRSELQPEIYRSPRYWSSYQIASWLQATAAPETWKTFGSCEVFGSLGILIITTTSEVHEQIERKLDQVRAKIEEVGRPAALSALAGQLYPDLFSPRRGFADVPNETHLYLYGRNRGDQDLTKYADPRRKFLTVVLADTAVTDQGLGHLKELGEVYSLSLWASQVTDGGLTQLQTLTQLRHLDLAGTPVTDAGLVHLPSLKSLQSLDLRRTHVTSDGVQRLRQALPNCVILPTRTPKVGK